MAKRTKKEALERLASLPRPPRLPAGFPIPPVLRPALLLPTILDQAGRAGARLLIAADPLNRLDDGGMTQEIINNPAIVMDDIGNVVELVQEGTSLLSPSSMMTQIAAAPAVSKPRKVTKKMRTQRKIQSKAFKNANAKGRKKNGEFKKGFDQSRIARLAQKECTKERQRLGLCEKPKKKGTRKGQVRKTARRAFE